MTGWATVVAGLVVLSTAGAATASAQGLSACYQKSSGQLRVLSAGESCKQTETAVNLSTGGAGTQGPPGPQGPEGPAGPTGPTGPAGPGSSILADTRWSTGSVHFDAFSPVAGSVVTATTTGGPLMITMDLSMPFGGLAACRPYVDGVWAGSFSAQPDDSHSEGAAFVGPLDPDAFDWRKWSNTRVYRGIPAGSHTFSISCKDSYGGPMGVNLEESGVWSAWLIIEMK